MTRRIQVLAHRGAASAVRRLALLTLAMLASLACSGHARGGVIITTFPTNNEMASGSDIGQTFRAPAGAPILSSIRVAGFSAGGPSTTFQLALFAFDDAAQRVSGGPLHLSEPVVALPIPASRAQPFTFDMDVAVTAGHRYLFVLRQRDLG